MSAPPTQAQQITHASKSNLALAFFALSPQRRLDMSVFYAFCRIIDDIADEPIAPVPERRAAMELWKQSLAAPVFGEPELAPAVRELIGRYHLPVDHFLEIIAGCEMDLEGARFDTWEDLRGYCHRVASVVGLVSIEIFGYKDAGCRQYALDLGLALQLTNILRDVAQDYINEGRIYLPREDMERFGYSEEALRENRHNAAFLALMEFETHRAWQLYAKARAALPKADQRSMVAAEIMRTIYSKILRRMQGDGFQVFSRRYRLNKLQKALCIGQVLLSPVRL